MSHEGESAASRDPRWQRWLSWFGLIFERVPPVEAPVGSVALDLSSGADGMPPGDGQSPASAASTHEQSTPGNAGSQADAGQAATDQADACHVLDGRIATDQDRCKSDQQAGTEVPGRDQMPAAARNCLRKQVADFAELAHRDRVPSLEFELAIGPCGGIAPTVVAAMAFGIRTRVCASPAAIDQQELTDRLMRTLVEPGKPKCPGQPEQMWIAAARRSLSLVATNGNRDERAGLTLVWPGGCQTLTDASEPADSAVQSAVASTCQTALTGLDGSSQTGLVVVGSPSAIADWRRYLGFDALLCYARQEVFYGLFQSRAPETAALAVRAGRNLEIVVLLDPALRTGVWLDVDPATGRWVTALAIELPEPASRQGVQITFLCSQTGVGPRAARFWRLMAGSAPPSTGYELRAANG